VEEISEAINMVQNDGSYDDMGIGLFPPNLKTAKKEINKVIEKNSVAVQSPK
jgi:hypothetical protein